VTDLDPGDPGGQAELDLLVLGSGVAGLSAAVRAADMHGLRVGVLTKGELHQATTRWAQGGVAAVLAADPDSTDLHLADTLAAGAGLCDSDAVRVLVDEGPGRVNELIALGAMFDRDEAGELELAREGGHSLARVVHAGGAATGVEVERALVEAVRRTAAALHENAFALDLLIEDGRCAGVVARDGDGVLQVVRAANVLLATGGAGQLFAVTTNPIESTGDGIAMALRAGAAVADVEFVQFHPTALHHPQMPRPLLSEALRGHGALLRDAKGERFVDELLPRDEVSRAMTRRMLEQAVDHLWLDATGLESFDERFPTISAALRPAGLDPAVDWLPIAPAAHYFGGGVVTDLDGAASLPGLWAAGEVACSGVHGANRLASNSLLEGMVFGTRVVEAIEAGRTSAQATGAMRAVVDARAGGVATSGSGSDQGPDTSRSDGSAAPGASIGGMAAVGWRAGRPLLDDAGACRSGASLLDSQLAGSGGSAGAADVLADARDRLQRAMTVGAGVLRSAESLASTTAVLDAIEASLPTVVGRPETDLVDRHDLAALAELANLVEVGRALLASATLRHESRGAHTRSDHPGTDPAFRRRIVLGGS